MTPLPAGEIVLKPDLKLVVAGKPKALPGPLSFTPAKGTTLTLDGKGYRGELRATAIAKALQIVDTVALDQYILGVVPGEMPKEWPAAALQSQAVAARSYALASIVKNRDFDLYADPRSQMYYGVAAESPTTTAAVKATKNQVLTYGGKVATTFYYSSSGGRTASSEDVFGLALPYLQSRPDPWDTGSPYHRWAPRSFTATTLAAAFGLSAPVVDVVIVPTAVGTPGIRDPDQEDRREDPAQGGRRPRSPGPPLDRVQARRAPRRPPAGGLAGRQARRRLGARPRRQGAAAPEARRQRHLGSLHQGGARRRRLVRRHRAAEGHGDVPPHRRRPGRPGADDHRSRGTGEVIARAAALVAAVVLSLVGTATAQAARFAVGIAPTADRAELRAQLEARGATRIVDLAPIAALAVTADRATTLRGAPGVRYVEALGSRRQSYVPNDPLLPQQWYATQNRSFDAWTEPPPLAASGLP